MKAALPPGKEEIKMGYKSNIVDMLRNINNEQCLRRIYLFVNHMWLRPDSWEQEEDDAEAQGER